MLDDLLGPQFALPQAEKERRLLPALNALTEHHRAACPGYARFLSGFGHQAAARAKSLEEVPWLPAGLFKSHDLLSVPRDEVFRVLTSSGTSGARTSRIFVDRAAAALQTRALAAVIGTLIGPQRLPMLIVDARATVARGNAVNARAAGILGMMTFGRDHTFALNDDMSPNEAAIADFAARHGRRPFLVFGFTFMVWAHLYAPLRDKALDLSNGLLVHSGGWKKLEDEAIDNDAFKTALGEAFGLRHIHNFYGMVEQIGSVFMEDNEGWLHAPDFADFVIRDPETWRPSPPGRPGIIELLSILPSSYPGHAVLTEDLGLWQPEERRDGAWRGKRLRVIGRVPRAEQRGCSDVHALGGGS